MLIELIDEINIYDVLIDAFNLAAISAHIVRLKLEFAKQEVSVFVSLISFFENVFYTCN